MEPWVKRQLKFYWFLWYCYFLYIGDNVWCPWFKIVNERLFEIICDTFKMYSLLEDLSDNKFTLCLRWIVSKKHGKWKYEPHKITAYVSLKYSIARVMLGYVSLVPYQHRVRLGLVQDHQRWSTWWENGIWTVSTFTCNVDLNGIRWINFYGTEQGPGRTRGWQGTKET